MPWTAGILQLFSGIFLSWNFLCSRTLSTPAPPPVTQTVETVEKVPFQKRIFEKWGRNIENALFFVF
jgi:hypothetical protein